MDGIAKRKKNYSRVSYEAYDGAAARVLNGGAVLQPRPLVRPRERALTRPRVKVREAGKVSIFAVVGFMAVGVFAVLLLMGYVQLAALSNDVVNLRSQMTELRTEEAKLRAKYELAYDLSNIEDAVTSNGSMVKPQDSQIFYVDVSNPDSVVTFQDEQPAKGVEGAVESVKEICTEVVEYFK